MNDKIALIQEKINDLLNKKRFSEINFVHLINSISNSKIYNKSNWSMRSIFNAVFDINFTGDLLKNLDIVNENWYNENFVSRLAKPNFDAILLNIDPSNPFPINFLSSAFQGAKSFADVIWKNKKEIEKYESEIKKLQDEINKNLSKNEIQENPEKLKFITKDLEKLSKRGLSRFSRESIRTLNKTSNDLERMTNKIYNSFSRGLRISSSPNFFGNSASSGIFGKTFGTSSNILKGIGSASGNIFSGGFSALGSLTGGGLSTLGSGLSVIPYVGPIANLGLTLSGKMVNTGLSIFGKLGGLALNSIGGLLGGLVAISGGLLSAPGNILGGTGIGTALGIGGLLMSALRFNKGEINKSGSGILNSVTGIGSIMSLIPGMEGTGITLMLMSEIIKNLPEILGYFGLKPETISKFKDFIDNTLPKAFDYLIGNDSKNSLKADIMKFVDKGIDVFDKFSDTIKEIKETWWYKWITGNEEKEKFNSNEPPKPKEGLWGLRGGYDFLNWSLKSGYNSMENNEYIPKNTWRMPYNNYNKLSDYFNPLYWMGDALAGSINIGMALNSFLGSGINYGLGLTKGIWKPGISKIGNFLGVSEAHASEPPSNTSFSDYFMKQKFTPENYKSSIPSSKTINPVAPSSPSNEEIPHGESLNQNPNGIKKWGLSKGLTEDQVNRWLAILYNESGFNQYGKDGKPLPSYAGPRSGLGIGQIAGSSNKYDLSKISTTEGNLEASLEIFKNFIRESNGNLDEATGRYFRGKDWDNNDAKNYRNKVSNIEENGLKYGWNTGKILNKKSSNISDNVPSISSIPENVKKFGSDVFSGITSYLENEGMMDLFKDSIKNFTPSKMQQFKEAQNTVENDNPMIGLANTLFKPVLEALDNVSKTSSETHSTFSENFKTFFNMKNDEFIIDTVEEKLLKDAAISIA